jgi:hypothetical protein
MIIIRSPEVASGKKLYFDKKSYKTFINTYQLITEEQNYTL